MRSFLSGPFRSCALLYKALPQFAPAEIDEWELWQIAVRLGRDESMQPFLPRTVADLEARRPRRRRGDPVASDGEERPIIDVRGGARGGGASA